jgi:hypothetical protein
MCPACSENGLWLECPTCRRLSEDYPLSADSTLGEHWGHITAAFKREWVMLVVALVLFVVLVMFGGVISTVLTSLITAVLGLEKGDPLKPFASKDFWINAGISQLMSVLVNIPIQGVGLVGLYRVVMDALVGKKTDVARMFSQLHLLGKYMVLQLVLVTTTTIPMMLLLVGSFALAFKLDGFDFSEGFLRHPEGAITALGVAMVMGAALVIIALSFALMSVLLFAVPELMVSNCTPIEAFQRAWRLGTHQRWRVIGYSFVAGLVVMGGFVLCCVVLLAAIPLSYMLLLSLFLALRRSAGFPPAVHD